MRRPHCATLRSSAVIFMSRHKQPKRLAAFVRSSRSRRCAGREQDHVVAAHGVLTRVYQSPGPRDARLPPVEPAVILHGVAGYELAAVVDARRRKRRPFDARLRLVFASASPQPVFRAAIIVRIANRRLLPVPPLLVQMPEEMRRRDHRAALHELAQLPAAAPRARRCLHAVKDAESAV